MINTRKRLDITRSCGHKQRHKSAGAAEAHIRSLIKRGDPNAEQLVVYICRYADHWHVGHNKERSS